MTHTPHPHMPGVTKAFDQCMNMENPNLYLVQRGPLRVPEWTLAPLESMLLRTCGAALEAIHGTDPDLNQALDGVLYALTKSGIEYLSPPPGTVLGTAVVYVVKGVVEPDVGGEIQRRLAAGGTVDIGEHPRAQLMSMALLYTHQDAAYTAFLCDENGTTQDPTHPDSERLMTPSAPPSNMAALYRLMTGDTTPGGDGR